MKLEMYKKQFEMYKKQKKIELIEMVIASLFLYIILYYI